MAVTLDDLRRNRSGFQIEPGANFFFQLGRKMSKRAHRTRQFANPHVLRRMFEADNVPLYFGVPVGKLETESDRLSMNSMSTPHHRRALELPRPALEDFRQSLEISSNDFRRLSYEQVLGGVHDIV